MGIKLKNKEKIKAWKRVRRVARVRSRFSGTSARPRLDVERTLKSVATQLLSLEKVRIAARKPWYSATTGGSASRSAQDYLGVESWGGSYPLDAEQTRKWIQEVLK